MKRIIALDPGGTTGWAMWQDEPFAGASGVWSNFVIGQIGPHEHHKELNDLLGLQQVHDYTIVCESFEFRKAEGFREGISLISREYIGVAKLFAAERMNRPVVLQTAGMGKGFIPDKAKDGLAANAKLKILGLYTPSMKHSNDAMRHLLYYLVNVKHMHQLIAPWRDL